ncbi:alpha-E domain-containing protein [Galbibacter mesophilus]|uniref:alpha-E domain-containing protein n=1 Tax=Galbibacter mesophilus TaxID=379069 RepID=UPI00191CEB7A|nr:alpha-E domain-containing protein [Galbibacter mesophilus]MCM5663588.1 alpha-E domain-containing protein [Galbibacter mesophilus]
MLARVANNLFWMGRYIERSEHTARYLNVNYFSSLDAPNEVSQSRQFVLRSMLNMVGDPVSNPNTHLDEKEVLHNISLNQNNYYSIIASVKHARENANSARDLISTELYEAINKSYHFVLNYPSDFLTEKGLYDFTVNINEMMAVLKTKIKGTLLQDEIYAIIMMGVTLERAIQIIRIINAKYDDALEAKDEHSAVTNSFEWITLLKCAESYDMMRRHYKKTPNNINTLEFLILNPNCPRSVMNSLNELYHHIQLLDQNKYHNKDSTSFLVGKIRAEYEFKVIEEISDQLKDFVENILNQLISISTKMENEYFNY